MGKKKKVLVITAVNIALEQVNVTDEENPRKLIFVIVTDGSTQHSAQTITATAVKLQR